MTSLPIWMSGKGDPLAKMALPPVAFWAAAAVHSDLEVGLERGKMIGGVSLSFIACNTSSVLANIMFYASLRHGLMQINVQQSRLLR